MRTALIGHGLVAAGLLVAVSGCSLFRSSAPTTGDLTRPRGAATDSAAAGRTGRPARDRSRHERPEEAQPTTRERESRPARADTTLGSTPHSIPETAPILTVRMSPEEEARQRARLKSDVDRAAGALAALRSRILTAQQQEQLKAAEQFLAEAEAARISSDLHRACSLAEKARIIAEELKTAVGR